MYPHFLFFALPPNGNEVLFGSLNGQSSIRKPLPVQRSFGTLHSVILTASHPYHIFFWELNRLQGLKEGPRTIRRLRIHSWEDRREKVKEEGGGTGWPFGQNSDNKLKLNAI